MNAEYVHLRNFIRFDLADNKLKSRLLGTWVSQFLAPKDDDASGGDFYVPFWADAKKHVAGEGNLIAMTSARMASNRRRSRLYPLLQAGFLKWWTDVQRQTNQELELLKIPIKGKFDVDGLGVLRVENNLALRAHGEIVRVVYPYFSEEPILNKEAVRMALWVMEQALSDYDPMTFEILDVVRGVSYRYVDCAFVGDEEALIASRYQVFVDSWWARLIKRAPAIRRRPPASPTAGRSARP